MNKENIVFVITFSFIVSMTLLKDYLVSEDPLVIIGVALIFSLFFAFMFLFLFHKKNKNLLSQSISLYESKAKKEKIQKIFQEHYKIFKRSGLKKLPELKLIESEEVFAYSYSLIKTNHIKLSKALIEELSVQSIAGVIAHEYNHIIHRDSHKKVYSLIVWVFFSLVWFFIFQKASLLLLVFFLLSDLFKLRKKEYKSDIKAVELTSLEIVLNSLFDFYSREKKKEENAWQSIKLAPYSQKLKQLIKFIEIKTARLVLNYFGTHPNWKKRLTNVLEHSAVDLSDKEFELIIAKALLQKKERPNHSLDWSKMGLMSKKLVSK